MFSLSHFLMLHPLPFTGVSESALTDLGSQSSFVLCSFPSQAKQEELEELNKELRQCNLQQFIQQTGVLPAQTHSRTELQEQLEQLELAHLLQEGYSNGGMEAKNEY